MASLFRNSDCIITEDAVTNRENNEVIPLYIIEGQRGVNIQPPIRDYIGFGAAVLFSLWCFGQGWSTVGLISLIIGGLGIYVSTKRKDTNTLIIFHFGGQKSYINFKVRSECAEASKVLSDLLSRPREND